MRWRETVEAILDVGRLLLEAKADLEHGEFGLLFDNKQVPFGWQTANKLMAVATDPVLSNYAHGRNLPPSWRTLYELTKLPAPRLENWPADGTVNAEPERRDATNLRRELDHETTSHPVEPLNGKYRVLYADPPWQYGNAGLDQYGHAERHYRTLSIEDLCALELAPGQKVETFAEDNAVLFIGAASPMLRDAFRVIEAWGFIYKTSFIRDKVKHNFGHYNSVRHEVLLVATRGSCAPDVLMLSDSVVVIERSEEHSEKPGEFQRIIDGLYTHGKRLELFARVAVPGWDAWGNQIAIKPARPFTLAGEGAVESQGFSGSGLT